MAVITTSTVELLYVDDSDCYIKLRDPDATPLNGYFRLRMTHNGYQSLYSLALAALANNLQLSIRANNDIVPTEEAIVAYIVAHA